MKSKIHKRLQNPKVPHSALALILFGLLAASSCNTPRPEKSIEADEEQQVTDVLETASQYEIDTAMSVVTWIGSKPNGKHNGIIDFKSGVIGIANDTVVGGKFIIDVPSLRIMDLKPTDENYDKLKTHLMSDDFFNAAAFPEAEFEITGLEPFDSAILEKHNPEYSPAYKDFIVRNPTHLVTGNLTMRGITKSITFPAKVLINEDRIRVEAKFNINRINWGLSYGDEANFVDKAKDKLIYNTVNVGLNLEAPIL